MVRRACLVVAPLLLAGYGLIRLLSDHSSPSVAWTVGHAAFLLAFVVFVPVCVTLHGLLPARLRPLGAVGAVLGIIGCLGTIVQAGIDITAGLLSADHAAMSAQYDRIYGVLALPSAAYQLAPVLFYLGLLLLMVLLAVSGAQNWLGVGLALVSCVLSAVDLDLIPLAGLCLLLALGQVGSREWRLWD
jgi:hypothetical protein